MQLFQELGAKVEELWRKENYNEDTLPEIAAQALREADLPAKVTVWEIAAWALQAVELPKQQNTSTSFGDPPITLYNSPRFYIDVYFWLEGTTAIHQHSFCGAFQVLHGSSIHSEYNFVDKQQFNSFFKFGEMNLRSVNLLQVGDVQTIVGGSKYIHALFHLDYPSATIVIRTNHSQIEVPQFSYHKPALAIDPFYAEVTLIRKQQIISMFMRAKPENADEMIHALLSKADIHTAFMLLNTLKSFLGSNALEQTFGLSDSAQRFQSFIETVRQNHGANADILAEVFAEIDRLNSILRLRSVVTDAELRYFFALLLNVSSREGIFSLIQARFPAANPLEKVLDWTETLGNTRTMDLKSANMLGIEDFNDDYIFVLEQLLQGKNATAILNYARENYPPSYAEKIAENLPKMTELLQNSPLFKPLLTE